MNELTIRAFTKDTDVILRTTIPVELQGRVYAGPEYASIFYDSNRIVFRWFNGRSTY